MSVLIKLERNETQKVTHRSLCDLHSLTHLLWFSAASRFLPLLGRSRVAASLFDLLTFLPIFFNISRFARLPYSFHELANILTSPPSPPRRRRCFLSNGLINNNNTDRRREELRRTKEGRTARREGERDEKKTSPTRLRGRGFLFFPLVVDVSTWKASAFHAVSCAHLHRNKCAFLYLHAFQLLFFFFKVKRLTKRISENINLFFSSCRF